MTNKIKILHVDDEKETLLVVKEILEKEGYEVVSVSNGLDAIKELKLNNYNLLILDLMMPGITGLDLFSKIIKIKSEYNVVFLSVLDLPKEKIKELLNTGAKAYIRKPFDLDDFVKIIKKVTNSL